MEFGTGKLPAEVPFLDVFDYIPTHPEMMSCIGNRRVLGEFKDVALERSMNRLFSSAKPTLT